MTVIYIFHNNLSYKIISISYFFVKKKLSISLKLKKTLKILEIFSGIKPQIVMDKDPEFIYNKIHDAKILYLG